VKEKLEAALWVNNASVELNPFVEEFLARTVVAAVSSLKGPEDTRSLELYLDEGDIKINVSGDELPLTPFPKEIVTNTLIGLVSSLKGVGKIDSLKISIRGQ